MRKLFKIGMYFFILNLLFGNSQTKEIESTQIPVLKVGKITLNTKRYLTMLSTVNTEFKQRSEITKKIIANRLEAAGDMEIKSEEGNVYIYPVNGYIGGKLTLTGKDINILDMQSERITDRETESSYVGVGVNFGVPAISAAQQIWEAGKGLTKARHKEDYINAGFGAFNAGMNAAGALDGLFTNPIGMSGSINVSHNRSRYHREESISVGSNLRIGKGVEYNGNNLHTRGLNIINEGDTVYNITGKIIKEAGKSTIKETSDGKGFGISVSHDMFNSAGQVQNVLKPSSGVITPSISREKGETTAVYYSNNQDITKGKTIYNNNPEVKVIGVDVKTKEIEGSVKSLDIISVQDSVNSSSRGYSISYGIGIGEHSVVRNGRKENANGLYTQNMGIGYSKGELTQRTTNAVGSFIAESGILNVEGKTKQVGSVIDGEFTLNTKEYEHEDLEDINKSRNIGINVTITPGVVEIYKNGMLTGNAKGGTAYGTRISFNEKDYVAKAKATIGSNVKTIIDGKEAELKEVNRDIGNRIEVIRNKEISPINIDLGTEYWGTDYAREKVKGDFVKAGNKIERVSEIIKGIMENENKDIVLYYKDRIDFEEERDRLERSGELETTLIDKEKAKEIAERASGEKIEDLQIISSKDPNIKEIVGANAIRGRAYHRSGKIIIVADNIEDYAKAIGVIAKEGRHFYHRRENGMEDTEDLSTFYGRQFERYNRKKFEDKDANFVTEQLRYTREQLGSDYENDAFELGGKFSVTAWETTPKIDGSLVVVRDPYKGQIDIYLRGSAGVGIEAKLAAAEAKIYFNYYPGALSLYDTTVPNMEYSNEIVNSGLQGLLNSAGIGVNDANMYIKYYNTLRKEHYFTGIGVDVGYSFSFGSIDKLIDKISIKDNKVGTVLSKEIAKGIVNYIKSKGNVETSGYIHIGSVKTPVANFLNPTDFWIKNTKRPKGK